MTPKKIAVLIRDRQDEALRMALGITLCDDIIDIYILDRKLEQSEKNNSNVRVVRQLEMNLYTNCKENEDVEYVSTEEIAQRLTGYDLVLPY